MMRHGMCFLFFLGILLVTDPAQASFRVCNKAKAPRISVAIAYLDNGDKWITEGWWMIKGGACETILNGSLTAQYYYIYASDETGAEWKGKTFMCTKDREFRIDGQENCLAKGYERTGFFEVDTGKNAKDWTTDLTDTKN